MRILASFLVFLALFSQGAFASTSGTVPSVAFTTSADVVLPSIWRNQCQLGRTLYLSNGSSRIDRYDLGTGQLLSSLAVETSFTMMCVSEGGLFLANPGQIFQVNETTGTLKLLLHLYNPSAPYSNFTVAGIAATRTHLYFGSMVIGAGPIVSLNLATGEKSASADTQFISPYLAVTPTTIAAIDGSGRMASCDLSPDGVFGASRAYTGVGSHVMYQAQAGRYILNPLGTICTTKDMKLFRQLGCMVRGVIDLGDGNSVVLSESSLRFYDNQWNLLGEQPVDSNAKSVAGWGGNWWVLHEDASNAQISFHQIDFSHFHLSVARIPLVHGEAVEGKLSLLDKRGNLLQASRYQAALLIWSPSSLDTSRAIALAGIATSLFYEPAEDAVYYAADGKPWLWRVDLSTGQNELYSVVRSFHTSVAATLAPFEWLQSRSGSLIGGLGGASGIQSAAEVSPTRGLPSHDGTDSISQLRATTLLYNASRSEWYVLDSDTRYPSGTHFYLGRLANSALSPNPPRVDTLSFATPTELGMLGLSPSGSELILSNGQVYSGTPIAKSVNLGFSPQSVAWASYGGTDHLFSVAAFGTGSNLVRHTTGLTGIEASVTLQGSPRALFVLPNGTLLLETEYLGAPRHIILDTSLKVLGTGDAGQPRRLSNFSIQTDTGPSDELLTVGFASTSTRVKNLLVRAVGPGLSAYGVSGTLEDPLLKVFAPAASNPWALNDNWGDSTTRATLDQYTQSVYAFALAKGSRDSALALAPTTALNTAEVSGVNTGRGRVLLEVYDAEEASGSSRLLNLSARCKVTPDRPAIGGFMVQGDKPMKLVLRGIGPKLTTFGVAGVLKNPKLTLYSGQTSLAQNDDWSSDATKATALKAAFLSVGAFALDAGSSDAAMIVEVKPGIYTLWLECADATSGIGLLEIYELQ